MPNSTIREPSPSLGVQEPSVHEVWSRYWPILILTGWLLGTVILFALGPIDYPVERPAKLYSFLALVHLALIGGFAVGSRTTLSPRSVRAGGSWRRFVPTLVLVSSLLNIAILIPSTLFMTQGSFDVVGAMSSPGEAYRRTFRVASTTTNPWSYVSLVVAPILALAAPLVLYFWRSLSWLHRLLGLLTIGVIWACGVLLGRNKGTADLVLLGLVLALVHLARLRPRLRHWLAGGGAVLVIFGVFFGLFSSGIEERMPRRFSEGYVRSVDGHLDFDNVFLAPFPDSLDPSVGYLISYLTQGYYGLELSLRLDFVWTRGLGNSFFLHMVEDRLLGSEFARTHCYPARVQETFGYDMTQHWHTIYPWLASDLGFPGTIAWVFAVGWLSAVVWKDVRSSSNPFAVALFVYLMMMIIYFCANNQMLAFPVQFSATIGIFGSWIASRQMVAGASASESSPSAQ